MTQSFDLSKLSKEELIALQKAVGKAITQLERSAKENAVAELVEVAKKHGFRLDELVGGTTLPKAGKGIRPATYHYINPKNPSNKWSGRGRTPGWFVEAEAEGLEVEKVDLI